MKKKGRKSRKYKKSAKQKQKKQSHTGIGKRGLRAYRRLEKTEHIKRRKGKKSKGIDTYKAMLEVMKKNRIEDPLQKTNCDIKLAKERRAYFALRSMGKTGNPHRARTRDRFKGC